MRKTWVLLLLGLGLLLAACGGQTGGGGGGGGDGGSGGEGEVVGTRSECPTTPAQPELRFLQKFCRTARRPPPRQLRQATGVRSARTRVLPRC